MADLIPDDTRSVLDIGCGMMWLRDFLTSSVSYYGLDYTKRDDNTIVCNLNNREFPDIKTDVSFGSGVVEYIEKDNLQWFFSNVRETSPTFIMSYCTLDIHKSIRSRELINFWKNHMTRQEVIDIVESVGFKLETNQIINGNDIFKFTSIEKSQQ